MVVSHGHRLSATFLIFRLEAWGPSCSPPACMPPSVQLSWVLVFIQGTCHVTSQSTPKLSSHNSKTMGEPRAGSHDICTPTMAHLNWAGFFLEVSASLDSLAHSFLASTLRAWLPQNSHPGAGATKSWAGGHPHPPHSLAMQVGVVNPSVDPWEVRQGCTAVISPLRS